MVKKAIKLVGGKTIKYIEYKAKLNGIMVIKVNPAYSSKRYHFCGEVRGKVFFKIQMQGSQKGIRFRLRCLSKHSLKDYTLLTVLNKPSL